MSNQFSFVGTLGQDSEMKYLPSGSAILTFSAACNTGYGDKKKTMWVRVSLFGKRAEGNLKDYLLKGQQVFVSGELNVNEFIGKDGVNKTSLELIANVVDLIGKRTEIKTRDDTPVHDYDDDIPFN